MNYYYVTKYALSSGVWMIPRDKARVVQFSGGTFLTWGVVSSAHGNDWHETREAAAARVGEMKKRRRKSLLKSLADLDRDVPFKEVEI